jgi:hypothetical protein
MFRIGMVIVMEGWSSRSVPQASETHLIPSK